VSVLLLALALPIGLARYSLPSTDILPAHNEARTVSSVIDHDFPDRGAAHLTIAVRIDGDAAASPAGLHALKAYVAAVRTIPGVTSIDSVLGIAPDVPSARLSAVIEHAAHSRLSKFARDWVRGDIAKLVVGLRTNYLLKFRTLIALAKPRPAWVRELSTNEKHPRFW